MIVLGIDPSLNSCGWAVLSFSGRDYSSIKHIDSGTIKTKGDFFEKLNEIIQKIEEIICKYKPDFMSIEETFLNTNAGSSLKLGVVRGAIFAVALQRQLVIKEHKPNTIKKTITGNGKADKQQVAFMLKTIFPKVSPKTNDESDAIAIAVCGVLS